MFSASTLKTERRIKTVPKDPLILVETDIMMILHMKETILWGSKNTREGEHGESEIQKIIAEIESRGEVIGSGKTADVMISAQCPGVCLKIISRKEVFRHGAHHELELMEYADAHGIPVPQPHGSIETLATDYLFMETIQGFDVRTLIEEDRIDQLPAEFNFKNFFERLRLKVKQMNEAQLYHRDLHEGNVMIDRHGDPVIIDFGASVIWRLGAEDPYKTIDAKGDLIIHPHDDKRISQMYSSLGAYLKENGYFNKKAV